MGTRRKYSIVARKRIGGRMREKENKIDNVTQKQRKSEREMQRERESQRDRETCIISFEI